MGRYPTVAELASSKPHLRPVVTYKDPQGVERVIYGLQPKQWEVLSLTPLNRPKGVPGPIHLGFGGQAGGGKSYGSRAIATAVAMKWPGSTSIIIRETEGDVIKNHVVKFKEEFESVIDGHEMYRWNGKEKCVTFWNGSRIYFGYLRHINDQNRYQGQEFDCAILEEANQLQPHLIDWVVHQRLRATVDCSVPFVLYPTNPGGPYHPTFKRLFIQRRYRDEEPPEDYAFVQSSLADNIELMLRDPDYSRKLDLLPEPYRSWYRDGNFFAGAGTALAMLDWRRHMVNPFQIPDYWRHFGAFDWGYRHPFSFGWYTVSEDGDLFKVDTVTGLRLQPWEQAQRIKSIVPIQKLDYIVAGQGVKDESRARGGRNRSVKDQFLDEGILLGDANVNRKDGLRQLMHYLEWRNTGPWINDKPTEGDPRLRFFRTKNNERCFEQIENAQEDPDDPEDILKQDANAHGEGGDDMLEETRFAVMSRPIPARTGWKDEPIGAFDPAVLQHEVETKRRHRGAPHKGKGPPPMAVT